MPYLSVIVPTMRVGGLNILFDGLARSEFTDFELVLVDGLHEHRKDIVKRAAWERFLKVVHVPPHTEHFPVAGFCCDANTGLLHASGEIAVFIVDYTRVRPDTLQRHAEFHRANGPDAGMMAPHRYVKLDRRRDIKCANPFWSFDSDDADIYKDQIAKGDFNDWMFSIGDATDLPADPWRVDQGTIATHDADPKNHMPAGPIDPIFFHGKNESVKLAKAIEINGWDEALDGSHGYQDSDFAERLSKAGVKWTLDPTAVVEIANPRGIFPFAKRLRSFEDNHRIWLASKAAGYPTPNKWNLRTRRLDRIAPGYERAKAIVDEDFPDGKGAVIDGRPGDLPTSRLFVKDYMKAKPLRVAMIYGEFSSAIHGPFDVPNLYRTQGLTGSESSFFNLARTLAERGHEVAVFCRTEEEIDHESGFVAIPVEGIVGLPKLEGVDAVIAWNEPDYLQFAPKGAKRICDQQLNDFGYCGPGWYQGARTFLGSFGRWTNWKALVDVWVSPSKSHVKQIMAHDGLAARVIPNSVDLDLFRATARGGQHDAPARTLTNRHPRRAIYCSSPDRGLHHLLGIWPLVRKRIPDAELKIFYRLAPWLAVARDAPDECGRRARFIEEMLPRLYRMGVEVCDSVPNERMARELQAAQVLAYPCDPANRYTEGFACSVLDACAAGCLPIISTADALPSVHGVAAAVVKGKVGDVYPAWVDAICTIMEAGSRSEWNKNMRTHAEAHSRERITDEWEKLIRESQSRTATTSAPVEYAVPV